MRRILCIVSIAVLGVLLWGPASAWAWDTADCLRCHRQGSTQSVHHMEPERFLESAHGKEGLGCLDCHSGMTQENHAQTASQQRVACSQCHEQKSRHQGGAQCVDCHGSHYILPADNPASRVSTANLALTCGACHPGQAGRPDYLSWLPSLRVNSHGKQDFAGDYSGDNCLACHRSSAAHGEVQPGGSLQCQRCHGPDEQGQSRLAGYFHPRADAGQQPGTYAAGVINLIFLGLMFIAGLIFFGRRASGGRPGQRLGDNRNEHGKSER
jgi:hypothetical protein